MPRRCPAIFSSRAKFEHALTLMAMPAAGELRYFNRHLAASF